MTCYNLRRFWRQIFPIVAPVLVLAFSVLTTTATTVDAMEDGKGFYPPGFRSSMAGFLPPPGTYGSNYKYFYSGSASGAAADGVALDQLGKIDLQADIDLDAYVFIDIPSIMWITPHKVLGGKLGFAAFVPVGWQDISVDVDVLATLTLPNGRAFTGGAQFSLDDDTINFGDPLLMMVVGWDRGNLHWNVAGVLNVPIGDYDKNALVNMGFNRWGLNTTLSATWLNAQKGHEITVAPGFTFNGENDDTNYKSGTEFHVEFAVMQHLSKAFAVGVTGYHYQQVTGDSGAGATLGSFKGRTTALGPNINYNFQWGQTPVSTSLRWLHEFDVKNRLEGDAVFFTAAIPLGGARPAKQ